MKKKLYIIIISILTVISVSTAFIPINGGNSEADENVQMNQKLHNDPEAGYIEAIGN